jgi:hypothetical protein
VDDDALLAPVDRGVSQRARDQAVGLVAALRAGEPDLLTIGGMDLGPALEQALFGRLRRLALRTRPAPAARYVHARSLLRLLAAVLSPRRDPRPRPGQVVVVLLSPAQEGILDSVRGLLTARGLPTIFAIYAAHLRGRKGNRQSGRLGQMLPRRSVFALLGYEGRVAAHLRSATAAWDGIAAAEQVPFLRDKAAELLPRIAIDALALDAVAGRGPALLGTLNEVARWSRLLPQAARRHGVPSLDIAHAEAADDIAIRGVDFDRYAVFGDQAAAVLRRAGVDDSRIVGVGAPRFDQLVTRHGAAARMPASRRVVVASQWLNGAMTLEVKRRTLQVAMQAAAAGAPVEVVIRPHPIELDSVIDELVAKFNSPGVAVRVDRAGALYDVLDGAWLLMTGWSNVVFEALLSNVPAICINATGGPWPVPFVESGLAIGATDLESVRAAVGMLRNEREWRGALERGRTALTQHLGPLDGRATERLADTIGEMIGRSRSAAPTA